MKRAWLVFAKTLREQARARVVLACSLVFAPCFVLLYWLILGGNGSTSYPVAVFDPQGRGAALLADVRAVTYPTGQPLVTLTPAASLQAGLDRLRSRDAAALLAVPPGFPAKRALSLYGDLTDPRYTLAAVAVQAGAAAYGARVLRAPPALTVTETAVGRSGTRSEFETYVPPLLILAVVLTLFQAALALTREFETGTARLMRLSGIRTWEWLAGVSAALVVISTAGLALTLATAVLLGFHAGPPALAVLIPGALCSLAVTGVGLGVAAFARTGAEALVYANLPLLPLMFLSGSVFPLPPVRVTLLGRAFNLLDLVPSTPAVQATHRLLTLGEGPGGVAGQLAWLAVLALATFLAGVALFERRLRRQLA